MNTIVEEAYARERLRLRNELMLRLRNEQRDLNLYQVNLGDTGQ